MLETESAAAQAAAMEQESKARAQTPESKGRRKPSISEAERNRLVEQYLPLVKLIALRIREKLPVHVELDDLISDGTLGLMDAAGKYDPNKNDNFSSYAKFRIHGAIMDSLRQIDPASRDMRRKQKKVEKTRRDLEIKLGGQPTEEQIATEMGVTLEKYRELARDAVTLPSHVSANISSRKGDGEEYSRDLPDPRLKTNIFENIKSESTKKVLAEALATLSPRYQQVIKLYYDSDEHTMKEIGKELDVNESRVSQIHKSALEKLNTALQERGINSLEQIL